MAAAALAAGKGESAILVVTSIDSCTSKSLKTDSSALTIWLIAEKSSQLSATELISDRGSELAAAEAGRLVIHASVLGNAQVQHL